MDGCRQIEWRRQSDACVHLLLLKLEAIELKTIQNDNYSPANAGHDWPGLQLLRFHVLANSKVPLGNVVAHCLAVKDVRLVCFVAGQPCLHWHSFLPKYDEINVNWFVYELRI